MAARSQRVNDPPMQGSDKTHFNRMGVKDKNAHCLTSPLQRLPSPHSEKKIALRAIGEIGSGGSVNVWLEEIVPATVSGDSELDSVCCAFVTFRRVAPSVPQASDQIDWSTFIQLENGQLRLAAESGCRRSLQLPAWAHRGSRGSGPRRSRSPDPFLSCPISGSMPPEIVENQPTAS
jgi:hypothetical protein